MKIRSRFSRVDFLNIVTIILLLGIIFAHIPSSYEGYKKRFRVRDGLSKANIAKNLVVLNAQKNKSFSEGWLDTNAGMDVQIRIHENSGIVSVAYPAEIDNGEKTLLLIPLYLVEGKVYPLASREFSLGIFAKDIIWLCTSAVTISKKPFIFGNLGTLQGKYAPTECRFSPQKIEQSE